MGDAQVEYCDELSRKLTALGIRNEVDRRNETIGYKIRNAQQEKVPYMLVVGGKELEAGTVAVPSRKDGDIGTMTADEFILKIAKEIADKAR
jgi:threonyl-tRNA synthetase